MASRSEMPSSRKLRFTTEAEADLRDILQFTGERWGARRRQAYAATLDAALLRLATFPGLGKQREELGPDLRGHPVGQHTVFYRVTDDALVVERIIHRARDVEGIL